MKKDFLMFLFVLGTTGAMTSCLSEYHDFGVSEDKDVEKGAFTLSLDANADFVQNSRALVESSYRNTANYDVQIVNTANNNIMLECKGSELQSNLPKTLDIGSYQVIASYGKEYDASRTDFYMFGSTTFTIKAKDEKTVSVNCTPTCGKVSVSFDPSMADYYSDYSVSFGGTKALGQKTFAWQKDDVDPWYIGLDANGETVTYTITLTAKEGYLHQSADGTSQTQGVATGSFKLDRNTAHKLTVKPNYTPTTDGGMKLSITIDESTNDHEITYEVPVTWI